MKYDIRPWAIGFFLAWMLSLYVARKQDTTIQQQRQLIKEMATNPQCLIPLHITEN